MLLRLLKDHQDPRSEHLGWGPAVILGFRECGPTCSVITHGSHIGSSLSFNGDVIPYLGTFCPCSSGCGLVLWSLEQGLKAPNDPLKNCLFLCIQSLLSHGTYPGPFQNLPSPKNTSKSFLRASLTPQLMLRANVVFPYKWPMVPPGEVLLAEAAASRLPGVTSALGQGGQRPHRMATLSGSVAWFPFSIPGAVL